MVCIVVAMVYGLVSMVFRAVAKEIALEYDVFDKVMKVCLDI